MTKYDLWRDTKKVQQEFYSEKAKFKPYAIKLPCGHGFVEILEPKDQIVVCGTCFKRHFLVWQAKPKIQYYKGGR